MPIASPDLIEINLKVLVCGFIPSKRNPYDRKVGLVYGGVGLHELCTVLFSKGWNLRIKCHHPSNNSSEKVVVPLGF